jgi:hydroxyacid-oxoacid transhydrogenase
MPKEFAFEMAASSIRFGAGVTSECGADLAELGARDVLVFTDAALVHLPPVATALASLESNGVQAHVFDRVRVEPNSESVEEAIGFACNTTYDAVVAVGGGSTIDTAKIANLYKCWPADFLDYVNQPIGKGKPVPGPVKPLFAIPTTAGTGSETTGVAIFDYKLLKAKTGIAHRRLKPLLGIVDPENTRTLPPAVAA